ncbi:MAG TPA: COX15/CtaA family protein [Gemmataceae bacterium]|nr:COX15/CtaA family protein [Gemmataceae bacterium]
MTTDDGLRTTDYHRWLHGWAVLTVCATVVLLGLGSAVTTLKAGMADPVWPTSPAALAQATPEQLQDFRWVVEHSHRLAGYVVGCCAIVLAVWLWLRERRVGLRWLGVAALAGVSVQGVVGGFRVLEHARWGLELRILHGAFAQVVLAALVSIAVFTGRSWFRPAAVMETGMIRRLRRWSLLTLGLVYLQVVLGVLLRHTYQPLWQRLHLLAAFAAVAAIVVLVKLAFDSGTGRPLTVAAAALAGIAALQVLLGVEAWMVQLASGTLPDLLPLTAGRVAVRTAHVLGGSLVWALTVVVALLARRPEASMVEVAAAPGGRLEEAA